LSAKLPDISRPQFAQSLLEVSRDIGDVGAPGSASGNFQSRVRTISLHGCGTDGGIRLRGPTGGGGEEEEEEDDDYDDNSSPCVSYSTFKNLTNTPPFDL
jgi:hypothetical protein